MDFSSIKFSEITNLRNAWVQNIERPDWFPKPYSRICSDHFDKSDFIHIGRKTFLKENAVPMAHAMVNSLFLHIFCCQSCPFTTIYISRIPKRHFSKMQ